MASSSQSGLSRRRSKTNNNDATTLTGDKTGPVPSSSSSSSEENQMTQVVRRTKRLKIDENASSFIPNTGDSTNDDNVDMGYDASRSESDQVSQNEVTQPEISFHSFVVPSQVQANSITNQSQSFDDSSKNSSMLNSSLNTTPRTNVSSMPSSQMSLSSVVEEEMEQNRIKEEMEQNRIKINDLPPDDKYNILCKILSYLPNASLINFRSVSKEWKELIADNFNILRIVIILRDINSGEEDSKLGQNRLMITNQLHTVQVETLGSNSNPSIYQMTLADIFSNLSKCRPTFRHHITPRRRLISTSPSKLNSRSSPEKYYRTSVWIYGVNLEVGHKEIEPLFRNYSHLISHLSLIQTKLQKTCCQISTAQLFKTLDFLKDTLEFLELSIFPPLDDFTKKIIDVDFFKLSKLRILRLSKPFEWINTKQSAKIIRELLRMSTNISEIQNFPFLLNFGPSSQSVGQSRVEVDLGSVTSMYFNAYHHDEEMARDDSFIHDIFKEYTNDYICPSFTFMKIDPHYNSTKCVRGFNQFLRWSKLTLKTLEIPPLLYFSHPIKIPMLPCLQKFIFTDVLQSELPFFKVNGKKDPNLGYKNLNTVQLNLNNVSSTSLHNYFPDGIFFDKDVKYFASVTRLKIHCVFKGDIVDSFKILSGLFPKVTSLVLKPKKGQNYLKLLLPKIPEFWPSLSHLTLNICHFDQLRDIPQEFVTWTIPNELRALISLKFRFPVDIPAAETRPDWIIRLDELLSNNLLPNLTVYVFCGWRLGRLSCERVSKYFETMHRVVKYNFMKSELVRGQ